jgi:hypothetical protein
MEFAFADTFPGIRMTMIVPIGITDAVIDGYGAGFAHGIFPGIAPGTVNLGIASVSWK